MKRLVKENIGGSRMVKVNMLYRPFHMKKTYKDIKEDKILSALYMYKSESLEVIVSRIINQAVLGHMNLCIDSTIMQMLALNDYLTHLFMSNIEALIFNYAINYLVDNGVEEIDEKTQEKLEILSKQVDMKTDFTELNIKLEELYKNIS